MYARVIYVELFLRLYFNPPPPPPPPPPRVYTRLPSPTATTAPSV
jgi:hypothetical protein